MIEYITSDRKLATYLYKQGYEDYEITVRDGLKVWLFRIPEVLQQKLKRDTKNFGT